MKYVWCLEMLLVIIFILGVCMCDFVMLLLWMIGEVFEILIGILFNWIVLLNGGSMWFICKYFRDNWLRILGWFSVLWLIINLKLVGNIMDLDFDVNICYLLEKKSLVLNVFVKLLNCLNRWYMYYIFRMVNI